MSEHDSTNPDPESAAADHPAADAPEAAPPPTTPFDDPAAPAAAEKPRWRDRTFRMRAVAAVAVAGLILGAAGGAVTTALVSDDHGGRGDHLRIGHQLGPGVPMVPPGGQQRDPGEGSEDGG
ncbi:hypothetical protein SFC88_14060 [Nocardioides sp. HM23]|uniref:hypothetical protein n=1 Tax=Nocardioides bizhenqiangii TaxID=3095076 RepID=UPI002ACAFF8A|nr:hypothetical protein [Nocardioides sp. HM23]MDZ5621967.1 hypothetical protein [Nocardioides sp. HM23]